MRAYADKPNPARSQRRTSHSGKPESELPSPTANRLNPSRAGAARDLGFDFSAIRTYAADHAPTGNIPLAALEAVRSPGQPLDSAARSNLEAHMGQRLDGVIIHADGASAASAQSLGARAYTVGNHIVFGSGQYRPGTMMGDLLLAHEVAHVAQQTGGQGRSAHEDGPLEYEANLSAFSFALSKGKFTDRAVAALRSGIRLQRCPISAEKINAPSFFGPDSMDTLNEINRIMSTGASLANWTRFGTIALAAHEPMSALHSAEAAEALKGIPTIIKGQVTKEVGYLLVTHDHDLNAQEKEFWNNFLKLL
jgi:hypothetical protein